MWAQNFKNEQNYVLKLSGMAVIISPANAEGSIMMKRSAFSTLAASNVEESDRLLETSFALLRSKGVNIPERAVKLNRSPAPGSSATTEKRQAESGSSRRPSRRDKRSSADAPPAPAAVACEVAASPVSVCTAGVSVDNGEQENGALLASLLQPVENSITSAHAAVSSSDATMTSAHDLQEPSSDAAEQALKPDAASTTAPSNPSVGVIDKETTHDNSIAAERPEAPLYSEPPISGQSPNPPYNIHGLIFHDHLQFDPKAKLKDKDVPESYRKAARELQEANRRNDGIFPEVPNIDPKALRHGKQMEVRYSFDCFPDSGYWGVENKYFHKAPQAQPP